MKKTKTTHVIARMSAGSRYPALTFSITPIHWGLEFIATLRNRRLRFIGAKVGPLCFSLAFFPLAYESDRRFENFTSVNFEKDD